ncbi:MAG: AraC family transcriptional regulator [Ardenticatenaceae bacterium]|nr:AraC family transcriptional regulator [Ardenticatenaceae bacterium]
MDVLDDVFQVIELNSHLLSRTEISPPWRFRFEESDDAQFHIINFGQGFLCVDGENDPRLIRSGDMVILPYGDGHEICDALDSKITKAVEMNHCNHDEYQIFPFAGEAPITVLLCGIFYFTGRVKHPFLESLPRVIHIRGQNDSMTDGLPATMEMIAFESKRQRPGASTMMQHLTDILFIQAIRAWMAADNHEPFLWFDALRDPEIGQALRLIHQYPQKPWSVQGLAAEVAVSRSAFSTRFADLVGESPIRYLTRWRMIKANGLLKTGRPITEVAHLVGYRSEVAFRKAFKRETGIPPGKYQRQWLE